MSPTEGVLKVGIGSSGALSNSWSPLDIVGHEYTHAVTYAAYLKPGAGVMMSGVPIGTVSGMDLSADGKSVLIQCRVLKRYKIHGDARFEIEQSGFLGDQYVSIIPLANNQPAIADGTSVRAQSPFNLQEAARSAVGLMQKLDAAATKIDVAVGRVEKELLSEGTISNLTYAISNFKRISERAESTLQEIELVVKDNGPGIGSTVSNINRFSERLSGIATRFNDVVTHATAVVTNLNDVIGENRANLRESVDNFRSATASIRDVTSDVQSGKGLAGGLLKDEGMRIQLSEVLGNVNTLSSNLNRYGLLYKPKQVTPLSQGVKHAGRSPF